MGAFAVNTLISVLVPQLGPDGSIDGPGFDASQAHAGTGLQNMRDRVGALDGDISLVTAVGDGTASRAPFGCTAITTATAATPHPPDLAERRRAGR